MSKKEGLEELLEYIYNNIEFEEVEENKIMKKKIIIMLIIIMNKKSQN